MTCPQSHGHCYPHQCKLDLFHQGTFVFKVSDTKDYFCSLMCLSKDDVLSYKVTDECEVETGAVGTWTTKIPVLIPYICFSGLLLWAVSFQARKDDAAPSQEMGAKCREEFFPVP